MDTKISHIVFLSLFTVACLTTFGQKAAQKVALEKNKVASVIKQQQMLKDYFLCSCIDYGFKQDSLLFKDHTVAVYTELLEYDFEDLEKVRLIAKQVADNIPISDYSGKRGVFGVCIDYYKGSKLNKLVKAISRKK